MATNELTVKTPDALRHACIAGVLLFMVWLSC